MVANDGWRIRLQCRLYDVININQDDCMALEEASMKNINQEVAEKEAEGEEDFLRQRQHVVASGDHRTKPKSAQRSIWPGQFTFWHSLTWVLRSKA